MPSNNGDDLSCACACAQPAVGPTPGAGGGDEFERLSHELSVYGIELSMQCEALLQTQQELERSREEYRALYEQAPIGYFTCTSRGVIVRANQSLAALLDTSVDALVGSSFPRFAGPDHRDAFHFHTVELRSQATAMCRMQLLSSSGELLDVRLDSRKQSKPDGSIELCVCVVDLTAMLRAEQRVRDVTAHSRRENERLRVGKLEAISQLAGGIAHDFNNLLAGILCNLALARSDPPQSDAILGEAESATRRAAALTNQLLALANGRAPDKQATSLVELITETAQFSLRGSKVRHVCEFAPDLHDVLGDASQLGQVIQNLVINAAEAMPEGGTVHIEAKNVVLVGDESPPLSAGDYVLITVKDTGVGITEADLPRIFEPYVTTKVRSSGLGLATVCAVIRSHGGSVTVRSTVDKGTTMNIHLPAAPGVAARAAPLAAAPRPRARTVARRRGRVLAMDDEGLLRRAYQRVLSVLGHEADVVGDGSVAVEAYRQSQLEGRPYDVAILDLTVPGGMGGVATLAELQSLNPAVRAIACSGYSVDRVMSEPSRYGFFSVIKKPFHPDTLAAAIDAAIGSTR